MVMKRIVILIVSGFIFHLVAAQGLKKFSEDPAEFITQFEAFMERMWL